MRRISVIMSAVVVLLSGAVMTSRVPAVAQEATPIVTVSDEITIEQTTFGFTETLPPAPLSIDYFRMVMPPGTEISGPRGDPGFGAHVVESGSLTVTFDEDMPLTRDGQPNGVVRAGEEAQLGPGDGFLWKPIAAGAFRNDGSEPAVVLVVLLYPQAEVPEVALESATPIP